MSWCDLDLTFDLAVVTLSLKILSGLLNSALEFCLLYVLLPNCAIYIDIFSPVYKFYSIKIFSLLLNVVILLLNCLVLILFLSHSSCTFSFSETFSSLFKYYLDLYITDTALKVSRSL